VVSPFTACFYHIINNLSNKGVHKMKGKRLLYKAFGDLMESYGIVDWAFVGRKVDGEIDSFWDAGTGKDAVGDLERTDVLHSEMERLQFDMLLRTTPKRNATEPEE